MYKKTTLENGLKIVTANMPSMKSIALGVWIRVGGRFETKENKGISHFLEHMVFKGSKKYNRSRLKALIEGKGGTLNGFTSEELTCYWAKTPKYNLKTTLDVLLDMSLKPILDEKEFLKERSVILEEIKMYKDLPQIYVYDLLDSIMWPDHPLGMPIIGQEESLSDITVQDMSRFQKKFYTAPNIVVALAGDIEHNMIADRISKIFSKSNGTLKNRFLKAGIKNGPRLKVLDKPTEQSHLAIGFHGISRDHKDRYVLSLINIILGANMSSRLFDEVREKRGLAYSIGTSIKFYQDTGSFLVHAGIENSKINKTLEVVLRELSRIKQEPVKKSELRRAKDYFKGQLILSLEDTQDQMLWVGEPTVSLDKIDNPDDIIDKVEKINQRDINRVAGTIFNRDSLNMSLIGPVKFTEEDFSETAKCLK